MESVTEAIREDGENSEKAEEIVTSAAMDVRVDVREDDNKTESKYFGSFG